MLSKLKKIPQIFRDFELLMITHWPGDTGANLRYRYWKKRLRFLGQGVMIEPGVYFQNPDFIHISDRCWIDRNVIILAGPDKSQREKITLRGKAQKIEPGVVHLGKNIHVAPGCVISGISAGVYLDDNCGLAANCKIYAFSHHYRSRKDPSKIVHFGPMAPHDEQCIVEGPVYVGANTGLAVNVVLLPGVSIQKNCFIGINSVVHPGKYEENSMLTGDPARRTEARFIEKQIEEVVQ